MMATKNTVEEATVPEVRFTKAQLLAAKKYADRRDLLNVVLADDKQYSFAEVDKAINDFMKKEVK